MQIKRSAKTDTLFLLLSSLLCHLLLSRYGFNPTDEGFVLSTSNRLLHGQIPHLNFSSLRPVGYAFIHIPELLISKDYIFLISRYFFWLENSCIAFLWIRWIENISISTKKDSLEINDTRLKGTLFYSLVFCSFLLNVHYFPCSVLHTIDGLLFVVIGLNIISSKNKYAFLGFLFIGYAALCKQNYLIILPVSLFLFKQKNYILNTLIGILPLVIYAGIISGYGGWQDLKTQLTSHHELIEVGIKKYLFNYFFLLGIIIAVLCKKLKLKSTAYLITNLIILLSLLVTEHYHGRMSFLFAGMAVGELIITEQPFKKLIWVCLILMWSVSISVGYNTPALFLGSYFSLIVIIKSVDLPIKSKHWIAGCLLIIIASFYARTQHIYRDAPAQKLDYKLDEIVEGAKGIYTNKNTFAVLKELDSLKTATPKLIVLPDFTACNILHNQYNPILTEWCNRTEIPNEQILKKVTEKLRLQKDIIIAVPKFQTALLKEGFQPLENRGDNYRIIQYVKANYRKVTESLYFEIYMTP